MKTQATTIVMGASQRPDSAQAAQQAAQMILEQLPPTVSPGWALAFCGGRHDQQTILKELRAALGDIPIVGGSAVGTITNSAVAYSGYECAVAVFPSSLPLPTILTSDSLDQGEREVGHKLGAQLRDLTREGDTVLIFYDSIRSGPPPVLHVGSWLMDGLYQSLGDKQIKLVGAGLIGDLQMTGSFVFDGRRASKHAVVAVALPSVVQSYTTIMHGCLPVSAFLEITRIEGAVLYELNGRPTLDVLYEMIGHRKGQPAVDNLSLALTIGEKHGDRYAPYDESAYVNRLILSSNPADGSVTLFEADFKVGTQVQIMSRDNQLVQQSVSERARQLRESLGQVEPVLALYIDCAGRTSAFSGAESEEASMVQTEIGPDLPLLGFYSGVEVAPLLGRSRPLDWTGVLTLFALREKP